MSGFKLCTQFQFTLARCRELRTKLLDLSKQVVVGLVFLWLRSRSAISTLGKSAESGVFLLQFGDSNFHSFKFFPFPLPAKECRSSIFDQPCLAFA